MESDFEFNRQSFDTVSDLYAVARPEYKKELFACIDSVRHFTSESQILEVGAGTGIATKQIADTWHPHITALEPGSHLLAQARRKLSAYTDIRFVNTTFEACKVQAGVYDGIFAATSFHWLDPAIKYSKAAALLKRDGLLIVFWNYYGIQDEQISNRIQNLYETYGMRTAGSSVRKLLHEKMKARRKELSKCTSFHILRESLFTDAIPYSAQNYINLLKTFSDHSHVPGIDSFYRDIARLIENSGGVITVHITAQLEIAGKV